MREKRQHPRATLVTNVEIYQVATGGQLPAADEGSETAQPGRTGSSQSQTCVDESSRVDVESRDISYGGMFLVGQSPCPVGTELVLMFDLPGIGRAQVPGFVRWHRADGFGVQFGLIGARETHAIGQLIRSQN